MHEFGGVNSASFRASTVKPQKTKYGAYAVSGHRARSAVTTDLANVLGLRREGATAVSERALPALNAAQATVSLKTHLRRVSLGHRAPLVVRPPKRLSAFTYLALGLRSQGMRFARLFPSFTHYELRQAVGDFFFTPRRPRFSAPPSQRPSIVRLVPALDLRTRLRGAITVPRSALRFPSLPALPRLPRFPRVPRLPRMRMAWTASLLPRANRIVVAGCAALTIVVVAGFARERAELLQARASVLAAQQLASNQAKQLAELQYEARTLNSSVASLERRDRALRSMVAEQRDTDDAGGDAPTTAAAAAQTVMHAAPAPTAQPAAAAAAQNAGRAPQFQVFASVQQASSALSSMAARVLHVEKHEDVVSDAMIAAIPSLDPTNGGDVTSPFGYRSYPSPEYHRGIDLAIAEGHPVEASADGRVTLASWEGGFGNKIEIDHGNGFQTWYAHLERIDVAVGQHVAKGQLIGAVGETGYATGPHLHYQIMLHGMAIDPAPYLHGAPPALVAAIRTR